MNVLWQAAPKYLIDSLEIIQRKSLRIILKKDWFCRNSELYSHKILPVSALCNLSSALLIFKMKNNSAKNNINFTLFNEQHSYSTRNNDRFLISSCRTQLRSQNFYVRGPSIYNNLPVEIRRSRSSSIYKTNAKNFFRVRIVTSDRI